MLRVEVGGRVPDMPEEVPQPHGPIGVHRITKHLAPTAQIQDRLLHQTQSEAPLIKPAHLLRLLKSEADKLHRRTRQEDPNPTMLPLSVQTQLRGHLQEAQEEGV